MNLKHTIIKEISEKDFRKLHLVGYVHGRDKDNRIHYVESKLNDVLDEQIQYMLDSGYEEDLKWLSMPIYIAIHKDNFGDIDDLPSIRNALGIHGYFDPMMNRYLPNRTYQVGLGIRHLYSTRDYYEDHDDYWRVSKKETKIIYKIKLDPKWQRQFVLKHKKMVMDWPYKHTPVENENFLEAKLEIFYDLVDGEYVEKTRTGFFKYEHSVAIIPVDKNGNKKK